MPKKKQSHQNKFHASALRVLTERFAAIREPDEISPVDRDLFEYFAELYKNSNRGIKGRGKDRKISGAKKSRSAAAANGGRAGAGGGGGGGRSGRGGGSKQHGHQEMVAIIASPNGSTASTATTGSEPNYEFAPNGTTTHMDEDEDEGSSSPYDQQQLPPLRPDMAGMIFAEDPMNVHTHIAKYHLDRKFQV